MPDLTTHYLFAKQTLSLLEPGLQAVLRERFGVFAFGAQGPDFFFFHQGGKGPLTEYGDLLHHDKLQEVFLYMAATLPLKKGFEQEILSAYCMGYVCHYLLDRSVHPFVYAEEERLRQSGGPRAGDHLHAKIEAQIDAALYQLFEGKSVTTFQISREMPLAASERWIIATFFSGLIKAIWSRALPPLEIDRAIRGMFRFSPLFYDQTGLLYHTASAAAALIRPLRGSVGHMKPRKARGDVLNQQRRTWENPFPPGQRSDRSVVDLFEQAKQEAFPALERIHQTGLFELDTTLDFNGRTKKLP